MRTSLSMKPTGWFQVGWSSTVPDRGVVPLRYFGQDLAIWRDVHGQVHVLDAYCQHLGANLAYGGSVTEEGIQCPFHGWTWSGEGRNVAIPYQDRPNKARRIRSWPVVELNEVLFLWHDEQGRAPYFAPPDYTHDVSEHLGGCVFQSALPDGTSHYRQMSIHPQVMVENVVDPQHFRFVHGTSASPKILRETVTETTWTATAGFGRRWLDGVDRPDDRQNTLTTHLSGVGVAFGAEHTSGGWRVSCIAVTPVDDATSEMFGTYWLEELPGSTAQHRQQRLDLIKGALPEDILIWENQKWLDPPGLATSEGAGFRAFRRWSRKFYPDSTVASAAG
jgi:nitrite reductase/ring-hydroxylating ferredoxin subunit